MKNIQIKHSKTDRDWSCGWTKKELIALLLFVFIMIAVEFLTAWLLRSMPNTMMKLDLISSTPLLVGMLIGVIAMKVVLISIPLMVVMLIGVIILSFGGVKQNENEN